MHRTARTFALAFALPCAAAAAIAAEPGVDRQQELIRFVRQECGFCHGLRLTGGLGSPLTAEAMRERDAAGMVNTILLGRPGTAMPGWRPFLGEADAEWIVRAMQKGFPEIEGRSQ